MAIQTLSNFNLYKENYALGLRNAINNATPLASQLESSDKNLENFRATWFISVAAGGSAGSRKESAALQTAGAPGDLRVYDDMKYDYNTLEISGPSMKMTKNDSAMPALEHNMESKEKESMRSYARQLVGQKLSDGTNLVSGVIGALSTDPGTGTTLTFAGLSEGEMLGFYVNMRLGIHNPTGGGSRTVPTDGHKVVAVDPDAKTVTVADAIDAGVASGDWVCVYGALDAEINGLRHLISSQKTAGVDPASAGNGEWKSLTAGSATTGVSEHLFMAAATKVSMRGTGSRQGGSNLLFAVSSNQYLALGQQLAAQKRFDGKTTRLKGGWSGVELAEGTLIYDKFIGDTWGFGINTDELHRCVAMEWDWIEDPGGATIRRKGGYDVFESVYGTYHQLIATNRNCHIALTLAAPVV